MKRKQCAVLSGLFLGTLLSTQAVLADAEYAVIEMSIDIDRSAEQVWEAVGGYCDIGEWLNVDCSITSGEGGMGTVRELAGGRVEEILIAQTPLSYGYTQPAVPGRFYDLYHGFMEARPVNSERSTMYYTLVYDLSNLADQEAKDEDMARRRAMFERALQTMKDIAEAR